MILCCGEALIEMIPSFDDVGGPAFAPHPGGAIFNTAVALGRLGKRTGFLSGISSDLFGRRLKEVLRKSRVSTRLVITTSRPTTLVFVQELGGRATYTYYDENTAGRVLFHVQLPRIPDEVTTLLFGGISLINDPCAEFYQDLVMRESGDRLIMMDPNVRAGIIVNEDRYRARLVMLMPHTDILKLSAQDLRWLIPGPSDLPEKAARLSMTGPKIVLLTRGAKGASAFCQGAHFADVPGRQVTVADKVGAGDAFNAGVLARLQDLGLLNKRAIRNITPAQLKDVVNNGVKVAGVTVSRTGANPPWADEL